MVLKVEIKPISHVAYVDANLSKVSNNQISNLRSSNYKGTEEEWQIILRWLLLGTSPSSEYQTLIEQVELVANVAADTEITFTIRQNIVGITVCFQLTLVPSIRKLLIIFSIASEASECYITIL